MESPDDKIEGHCRDCPLVTAHHYQALIGWEQIASATPFDANHIKRKYGKSMQDFGYVMKDFFLRPGEKKHRLMVWSWRCLVMSFFAEVAIARRAEDKKPEINLNYTKKGDEPQYILADIF